MAGAKQPRKKGHRGLRKHGRSYRWDEGGRSVTHKSTKYRLRHRIGIDEHRGKRQDG